MSDDENKPLRPQTYAGLKYYDIITATMQKNLDAMLASQYQMSATLLFDYYANTHASMGKKNQEEIRVKLDAVQKLIDSWEMKSTDSIRQSAHLTHITRKLRNDLRVIHIDLMMATKDLMMKFGSNDDGELDWSAINKGG